MRIWGMAVLVLAASVLAGCGGDEGADDDAAWRTSQDPVEGHRAAPGPPDRRCTSPTARRSTPAIPCRRSWSAATACSSCRGETGDEGDRRARPSGAQTSTSPDRRGSPPTLGLDVDTGGVRTSPDGAHLAVLEADYDEGSAVMRVFDLSAGTDVTSEDGMEPGSSDPVDELLEAEVEILGIDDDEVFARTLEGDVAYDLSHRRRP